MSWDGDFESVKRKIIYPTVFDLQKTDNELVFGEKKGSIKDNPFSLIFRAMEEYQSIARQYMDSDVLDRHKLAACFCGAVMSVKPITRISSSNKMRIYQPNECLAVFGSLRLIRPFVISRFFELNPMLISYKHKAFCEFEMMFPDEPICDKKEYAQNLLSALERAFKRFDSTLGGHIYNDFDIWAYSKIFYHLDIYNHKKLSEYFAS